VLLENGIVMVIVREKEERKEQKERNRKDTAWKEKENADNNTEKSNDHMTMAKKVDKLSFGFCLIMFVLFNVLFWSLYL
jgi:hypothetical protein